MTFVQSIKEIAKIILQVLKGHSIRNNLILTLGIIGCLIFFFNGKELVLKVSVLTLCFGFILNLITNTSSYVNDFSQKKEFSNKKLFKFIPIINILQIIRALILFSQCLFFIIYVLSINYYFHITPFFESLTNLIIFWT